MSNKPFVHLHLHNEYSLLDGATRIDALLDKCIEYNMPAVAVTDHGNMYCAWKFFHAAKEKEHLTLPKRVVKTPQRLSTIVELKPC